MKSEQNDLFDAGAKSDWAAVLRGFKPVDTMTAEELLDQRRQVKFMVNNEDCDAGARAIYSSRFDALTKELLVRSKRGEM